MQAIFPRKWDDQFTNTQQADQCVREWAEGIKDLSDTQLARGVEKTRQVCPWPPSIAEFRKLCIRDWRSQEHLHQNYKALPMPKGEFPVELKAIADKLRYVPETSSVEIHTKPSEDPKVSQKRRQEIVEGFKELGFNLGDLGLSE